MKISKTKIRQATFKFKQHITVRNIIIFVALILSVNWIISTITTMYKNYDLQRKVDLKKREALILEIETMTLEYERNYHKTKEYQELAAREKLNLAFDGEKLLVLPKNSEDATNKYNSTDDISRQVDDDQSNFYQWMKFLFGSNSYGSQSNEDTQ